MKVARVQSEDKGLPPPGSSSAAVLPACANPGAGEQVSKRPLEEEREGKHWLGLPKNCLGFCANYRCITNLAPSDLHS